jgi:sugar lactone lactonase YvrE
VFIDGNDTLYVADHQSNQQTNPGFTPGIRVGSAKDGKVTAFISDTTGEPSQEGVAADAAGNIYGALTGGMALRKYVRK